MRDEINAFFSFSRSERRGMTLLICIFFALETVFFLLPYFESPIYIPDASTLKALRQFEDSLLKIKSEEIEPDYSIKTIKTSYNKRIDNTKKETVYFNFDPNTLPLEGWQKLGFSEKQASVIVNYRKSSKPFRSIQDLERIFVIGKEGAKRLEPFAHFNIPISDSSSAEKPPLQAKQRYIPKTIELNSADTLELTELRGIGPSWARRIVRYRDRLGGYISLEQLFELKGMTDSLMDKISTQLVIDTNLIQKLNVNEADVESLRNHPYIHSNLANSIVNFRLKHGPYKSAKALLQLRNLKEEDFDRLKPYIRTE